MTLQQLALYIGVSTLLAGCAQPGDKRAAPPDVVLVTTAGEIGIHLYDETPLHKAQFLNLAKSGFFDSLSFHRIIPGFMIQSGDPRSRGTGHIRETGVPEDTTTLAPEFREHLVHLNGQIGAARWGDDKNPGRRSSGSQFYIVTGAPVTKTRLDSMDQACTAMRRGKFYAEYLRQFQAGIYTSSFDTYLKEHDVPSTFYSPWQRKSYLETGGAPWLDQTYTIFGEVVSGMEIATDISYSPRQPGDQPVEPTLILKTLIPGESTGSP